MKDAVRSRKNRRCEHFAHRDVDVGRAVLEVGLLCGIRKRMKHHADIRLVLSASLYGNVRSLIEHVDDALLNLPVTGAA